MEINGTIHPEQQLLYVRDDLFKILGNKIKLIPNAHAVLIFPKNEDYETIIKSVEIILADLKNRTEENK